MNTRITLDRLMDWGPCEAYPRKRIKKLFAGRAYVTPAGVHKLAIPLVDRMWVLHELLRDENLALVWQLLEQRDARFPNVLSVYDDGEVDAQAWFYAELLKIFGVKTDGGTGVDGTTGTTETEG